MATYNINAVMVLFGNTKAAVDGAVTAARRLKTPGAVVLVTDRQRIGGMAINSLIAYDAGRRVVADTDSDPTARDIGGWTTMGLGPTGQMWRDQAEIIGSDDRRGRFLNPTTEMLCQRRFIRSGATPYFGMILTSVQKTGAEINSITCTKGGDTYVFAAALFAECGLEGDLMRMALSAGAIERGRNAESEWGDSLGGALKYLSELTVNPYDGLGALIPGVTEYPELAPGDADDATQIMGMRFEVGRVADGNSWGWPKPKNYDEDLIQLWIRRLAAQPTGVFKAGAANGLIYDLNNFDGFSEITDAWLTATPAERGIDFTVNNAWDWTWTEEDPSTLYSQLVTITLSRLWYQRNKGTAAMRDSMKPFGLSRLAHPQTRGVAPEPYLRGGGWRLKVGHGGFKVRQDDMQRLTGTYTRYKSDSYAIGTLKADFHEHRVYPHPSGTKILLDTGAGGISALVPFGDGPLDKNGQITTGVFGWQKPMRQCLPPDSEATNLVCATTKAQTNVAQASDRCEKDYGNDGVFAGLLGAMMAEHGWTMHDAVLNHTAEIQAELRALGQVIDIPGH